MFESNYEFLLGTVSVLFSLLSYSIYYASICRGETVPHAISWIIWGGISLVIAIVQFVSGAGLLGTANMLFVALACFGVILFFPRKQEKHITLFDKACLFFAVLAAVAWVMTGNINASISLLIVVDILGFLPTLRKSWSDPFGEHAGAYVLAFVGYFASLFALKELTFLTGGFVINTAFFNIGLAMLIYVRKIQLGTNKIATKTIEN